MDQLLQYGAVKLAFEAYYDLSLALKVVMAISLAVLLHKAFSKPAKYRLFPAWAAIEIAIASNTLASRGWGRRAYSILRRYGGPLFGITSNHQILVDFPGLDRLMSHSHTTTMRPVKYTFLTRIFGITDTPDMKRKLDTSIKDLEIPIERFFLNEAAAVAAITKGDVADKAAQFVSFSTETKHMRRWELSAGINLVEPDTLLNGQNGIVEANLQSLVRDFGVCFAISVLYGQGFLDDSPQLLGDLWKYDNELVPLLMIGLPTWLPLKVMKEGLASQSRLLNAVESFYRRIDKIQHGNTVDVDMSDVSNFPFERNAVYERDGWSFKERAGGDFSILWGQNVNTQPALFWLVVYIYSTLGLLATLREEIEPYISLSPAKDLITCIKLGELFRSCHLLKSCVLETYRMSVEPVSLRYVLKPITVTDGGFSHQLKPGMFISVPHGLTQRDSSVYADPNEFVPHRFLERNSLGHVTSRYGKLRPWGSGAGMCKGRTFAEREIIALSAAIIALWDISPANGTWKIPTMVPGTGVKKPIHDIRVRITRRKV
ncbi:putative cytochrome P450 [Thozetella sp. PMI_491]|nr:putative cytochrome P450 [Thozetella sp. PMI_491]